MSEITNNFNQQAREAEKAVLGGLMLETERFDSVILKISDKDFSLKPEFEGFDDLSYEDWFKKNRKKKLFLPIYRNFNNSFSNNIRLFIKL